MFGSGVRERCAGLLSGLTELAAAAALVAIVALAAPAAAAAQVSDPPGPVAAYTLTPQRITAQVGVLVGLIGAVGGGLALSRAARSVGRERRRGAALALVMGPLAAIIGGQVVATAKGGLGTGQGLAGGVVAVVVGMIATALGALARVRSRRTASARPE
ncbi:conserved hypothetical protein [Anaeromyxobacter dehalogenans 2CP-1]|uniref:Uncharacterized protein n=1 Tax=Anaeromyxobacter dehalogenans (strain ATCC BAA-258 / DSM 21875 / 2CP-1) TaxID=455488 RepID=B8JFM9_ANAD2|nr:DUF6223 family protein [Anaeromyxobacter dehalogenans]ACL66406.1 conserved hypothetical protein [Anaeromyxobacter dehalogenans 2CP-1]